jgi:hypothetical protein
VHVKQADMCGHRTEQCTQVNRLTCGHRTEQCIQVNRLTCVVTVLYSVYR